MPNITFILKDNTKKRIEAQEGLSLLEIAQQHDVDLHGACHGALACATCHVIIDEEHYNLLPPPSEQEEELLDFAFGVTSTSRLACQVIATKDLDGMIVKIPSASRNIS